MHKIALLLCTIFLLGSVYSICIDTICCDNSCSECGPCSGNLTNDLLCCETDIIASGIICNSAKSNTPCIIESSPSPSNSPTKSPSNSLTKTSTITPTNSPSQTITPTSQPSGTTFPTPSITASHTITSSQIPLPTPSQIQLFEQGNRSREFNHTINFLESTNYTEVRNICCNDTMIILNDYCVNFTSDICGNLTDICCENITRINNIFCNSFEDELVCPEIEDICCNGTMPYNNTYCNQFYFLACVDLNEICCNYTEIIDNEYCNRFGNITCKNLTELCCDDGKKVKDKFCNSFKNITCSKPHKEKVVEYLANLIATNYVVMAILIAVVLCLIILFTYSCFCFGNKSPPQDYNLIIGRVGKNK